MSAGPEVIADPATTVRISVSTEGAEGAGPSGGTDLSADGRFAAFSSEAPNLVPGDTNRARDVFVRDRDTDGDGVFDESGAVTTARVSVNSQGGEVHPPERERESGSSESSISADGRYVAFRSNAPDLVASDVNGAIDTFVHDRATGVTTRVSVSSTGRDHNGSYAADPAISADGRYVAFESDADNLVPGDTNFCADVFVHDRLTRRTERASVGTGGIEAQGCGFQAFGSISGDGHFVAFASDAANLVEGDTNGQFDIFVHDRLTRSTERVSVTTGGLQANGPSQDTVISDDGRFVGFRSLATNLVAGASGSQVYVHDRTTGTTTLASVSSLGLTGDRTSLVSDISPDGRYVVMASFARNFTPGANGFYREIYVHDRATGQTWPVSVGPGGILIPGDKDGGSITADGRTVGFGSFAPLTPEDRNGTADAYVRHGARGVCVPPVPCILDR